MELGRDVSTISRELSRNLDDRQRYRPFAAQLMATARLARPRPRRVEQDLVLAAAVQDKLDVKWSPEQISNTLAEDFPADPSRRLSTESIHQALYAKGTVLQRDPALCLRSRRSRRRPHRRPGRRRPNAAGGPGARPPISDRPTEADDRTVAGHWGGDLITGRSNKSAITTLVERASGALLLVHLPGQHTTEVTVTAMTAAFTALPPGLCRSLTWDRGTEMGDHALLTLATGMPVFFADAHSPWQRGTNENFNGLTRQYLPKSTDLAVHSPQRLLEVQDELNARPRKRYQWATPTARLVALQSPHE